MKRAVFLDRDGTLIEDRDYLHEPRQVVFFPGSLSALKSLCEAGFALVMVTNQSGVGRGYFSLEDVHRVHEHIALELSKIGVAFTKIYIAPEAPEAPSRGRKPSPQFLFDACEEFGIFIPGSYMIGDKRIDLECGWNAGVKKSILVRTGYGKEVARQNDAKLADAYIANDLPDAARWILTQER
jgi:D-glycero-D-manno-heptose 1,7-bisphosphate phosphatase